MLKIDFINVGYGDSILVREYRNEKLAFSMLVDTGDCDVGGHYEENRWRIRPADFLKQEGIDAIDLLVITHLHKDHVGGILDLAQRINVRELWGGYLPPEDARIFAARRTMSPEAESLACALELYAAALARMRDRGTRIRRIGEIDTALTDHLNASFLFGWNRREREHDDVADSFYHSGTTEKNESALLSLDRFINNMSLVLLLTYEQRRILFAGDAYLSFWKERNIPMCDLLKLAHHGHTDAVDARLAAAFAPQYVVISVSDSRKDDCPSIKAASAFDILPHLPMFFCTDGAEIPGYCACRHHSSVTFQICGGFLSPVLSSDAGFVSVVHRGAV